MASNVWRASRSSPAPWIRGGCEITCSISVVPERGRPKTNTGRRRVAPATGVRAKNSVSKASMQAVDEPLVLGRDVLAVAALASSLPWRWPRGGIRRRGRVRRGRRGREAEQQVPRPRPKFGIGQPALQRGEVLVGQLAAEQRRQPGVGDGEFGWILSAARKAASASARSPLLLGDAADVELRGPDVQLRAVRNARRLLDPPSSWSDQPSRVWATARSGFRVRACSKRAMASPGSSRSTYNSARYSHRGVVGFSSTARFSQGRASLSWPSRTQRQAEVGVRRGQVRLQPQGLGIGSPSLDQSIARAGRTLPRLWCAAGMSGSSRTASQCGSASSARPRSRASGQGCFGPGGPGIGLNREPKCFEASSNRLRSRSTCPALLWAVANLAASGPPGGTVGGLI